MKTPDAKFPVILKVTKRADGNYDYTIKDYFRAYPSVETGFKDRTAFLQRNSNYAKAGVFTASDPFAQIDALFRAGYATDPNYAKILKSVISSHGLESLDLKKKL